MSEPETQTVTDPDGTTIYVYRWRPQADARRGVVHVAHGMGEHARRYDRVADALVRAGFAVYADVPAAESRGAEQHQRHDQRSERRQRGDAKAAADQRRDGVLQQRADDRADEQPDVQLEDGRADPSPCRRRNARTASARASASPTATALTYSLRSRTTGPSTTSS